VAFLAAGFLRAAVFFRVVAFLAAGFLRAAVFFRVVAFLAAGFLRAAVFFRVVAFLAAGFLRAAVFFRVVALVRVAALLLLAGIAITLPRRGYRAHSYYRGALRCRAIGFPLCEVSTPGSHVG
jgi:hypothetical protein